MNNSKIGIIVFLLIILVIGLTGIACADPGVNATPETQVLSTVSNAEVIGIAMETDTVAWTLTDPYFITTGILYPGEVQYTTAYDANIVAQGGKTSFIKQMNIDTRNKVSSQSNVNAQTELTFAATDDGGNVAGEENLMLDGAGSITLAEERMLCPFASDYDAYIPAFCNIVQSGSKYDLTIGSVTTNANERFAGTDSTDAVVMNYAVNIKPYGTSQGQFPASGSAMAYIRAHVQESRDCYSCKAEDLTYSETGSALGSITGFRKEMSYSSQVVGPLPTMDLD